MSKDDRLSTAYDNLSRISQYENAYSQIVYQVNQSFQNGLVSSIMSSFYVLLNQIVIKQKLLKY